MQNIEAGGMPARSGGRDEMYRAVVSELASLIDHIRKKPRADRIGHRERCGRRGCGRQQCHRA